MTWMAWTALIFCFRQQQATALQSPVGQLSITRVYTGQGLADATAAFWRADPPVNEEVLLAEPYISLVRTCFSHPWIYCVRFGDLKFVYVCVPVPVLLRCRCGLWAVGQARRPNKTKPPSKPNSNTLVTTHAGWHIFCPPARLSLGSQHAIKCRFQHLCE